MELLCTDGSFGVGQKWIRSGRAFMHGTDDVCFRQELVRNILARSQCNSQCDVAINSRRNGSLWANVVDFPLRRSCVQVCDVADVG